MVVKWLEGAYIVPWDLEHEVEHMKRIIEKRHIKVQHCFREANTELPMKLEDQLEWTKLSLPTSESNINEVNEAQQW
ncbi:hypothetical protein KY284_019799 [Solanum tuberosum]|nr:hypothetical protein KY284_019799 [Solanum tuberosum]